MRQFDVLTERADRTVALVAVRARKANAFVHRFAMLAQIGTMTERLVTLRTLERTNLTMYEIDVCGEIRSLTERAAALAANMRPIIQVNAIHVTLQLGRIVTRIRTSLVHTRMFLGVCSVGSHYIQTLLAVFLLREKKYSFFFFFCSKMCVFCDRKSTSVKLVSLLFVP